MEMDHRIEFNALFSAVLFVLFAGYGTVTTFPLDLDHSGLLVGAIAAFFVASMIGNVFVRVANLALLDDVNLSVVNRMIGATLLDSLARGTWLGITVFTGLVWGSQNPFYLDSINGLNNPTSIAVFILAYAIAAYISLSIIELFIDLFRSDGNAHEKKKRQQTEQQQIEWTIQPEQQSEKYHFSDEHLHRGIRR